MKESPGSIVINYVPYKGYGTPAYMPVVSVVLSHKNRSLTTRALVDSGATATIVPLHVARMLEVELKEQDDNTMGVGGNLDMYLSKMDGLAVIEEGMMLARFDNQTVLTPY